MSETTVVSVACIDCPHCRKEIVRGTVREKRTGFNSNVERSYVCKHCNRDFTAPESSTQVKQVSRALLEANYGPLESLEFVG